MPDRDYSDISCSTPDNERAAKLLIEQYQQRVFALVLYLIGDDRDKAYDITASSFVEAFSATFHCCENSIIQVHVPRCCQQLLPIYLAAPAIQQKMNVKEMQ